MTHKVVKTESHDENQLKTTRCNTIILFGCGGSKSTHIRARVRARTNTSALSHELRVMGARVLVCSTQAVTAPITISFYWKFSTSCTQI